ncbi:MAG: 16S rRNA (adenine(1518)-N(6)/adenine(1519)-N(6))-dimethyltransferase RsmA [Candidatus Zambryskibacteria bacterium]
MRAKKSFIAKRSLGQNFLRDEKILKKIADFAQIKNTDTVVEVGPGEGTLTELLLERAAKVIAIEKDEGLAEKLKERFKDGKKEKLEIINKDVLRIPDEFFLIFFEEKSAKREKNSSGSWNCGYKLVGNIPYYITGALFKKFLQSENQPKSITFVVQKEVAERIMAKDGKESLLSISIKVYGKPEYGGIIKAGSFNPKPKVDSAIIAIRNINKERFKDGKITEERFFEILKKGFAHKRKLLIKNLGAKKEIFDKCEIPEKARAENLKIEDWICLTKELSLKFSP